MASRCVGRLGSRVLQKKCSASILRQHARKSTRRYVTQPALDGQNQASTSPLTTPSSTQQDRDPSLPPKPPPGTYPHPFPNSRDDPHSNSMRVSYQRPASMSQKSRQSPHMPSSRQGAFSGGANNLASGERWAQINAMSGIDPSTSTLESLLPTLPPLCAIHVKSTSNNTIITLHAPSTPKSQVLSKGISKNVSIGRKAVPTASFSVESNPDAVPQEEVAASESSEADPPGTYTTSSIYSSPQVTPADPTASSSFTPPKPNRCIGWASGGSCHYKKVNRSTYEAGYSASVRIIRRVEEVFEHLVAGGRIEDLAPMKEVKGAMSTLSDVTRKQGNSRPPLRLRVVYTGFGTGREAFNAAVLSADGAFVRGLIGQVQDKTPIKVGGCRGKKTRRV